jgi:hypothetical protein
MTSALMTLFPPAAMPQTEIASAINSHNTISVLSTDPADEIQKYFDIQQSLVVNVKQFSKYYDDTFIVDVFLKAPPTIDFSVDRYVKRTFGYVPVGLAAEHKSVAPAVVAQWALRGVTVNPASVTKDTLMPPFIKATSLKAAFHAVTFKGAGGESTIDTDPINIYRVYLQSLVYEKLVVKGDDERTLVDQNKVVLLTKMCLSKHDDELAYCDGARLVYASSGIGREQLRAENKKPYALAIETVGAILEADAVALSTVLLSRMETDKNDETIHLLEKFERNYAALYKELNISSGNPTFRKLHDIMKYMDDSIAKESKTFGKWFDHCMPEAKPAGAPFGSVHNPFSTMSREAYTEFRKQVNALRAIKLSRPDKHKLKRELATNYCERIEELANDEEFVDAWLTHVIQSGRCDETAMNVLKSRVGKLTNSSNTSMTGSSVPASASSVRDFFR